MDPVTHLLAGAAVGNAFCRNRLGDKAAPVLMAASLLPDIDALAHLAGADGILWRRTLGHSLYALPLLAAGLAWGLKRWKLKHHGFWTLYWPILLGCAVHLVLDLINSFGVVLLWPFDDWRPELAMTFIIDLFLTATLALPLLLSWPRLGRSRVEGLARLGLIGAAAYLLLCGTGRSMALLSMSRELGRLGIKPDFMYVFPEPYGPLRWRGVLRAGGIYRLYLITPFKDLVEPKGEVETLAGDPRVEAVRRTDRGRRLEWFFKAPVWSVRPGATFGLPDDPVEVGVRDLRFASLLVERRSPFQFRFLVRPDGTVESL